MIKNQNNNTTFDDENLKILKISLENFLEKIIKSIIFLNLFLIHLLIFSNKILFKV